MTRTRLTIVVIETTTDDSEPPSRPSVDTTGVELPLRLAKCHPAPVVALRAIAGGKRG